MNVVQIPRKKLRGRDEASQRGSAEVEERRVDKSVECKECQLVVIAQMALQTLSRAVTDGHHLISKSSNAESNELLPD